MKESVTKFDLSAAFKALDEIEVPKVGGVKPNRTNKANLRESVRRADRTSALIEEYYDVQNQEDLDKAQDVIDADIAKAKLARIEKIVDLDAKTEEDIQPSYVGKVIIQCPQCMTLFYKKPEDIERSDENDEFVNIGEECQHCGNTSGYAVIGKVAAEDIAEEEPVEETAEEEVEVEEEVPQEETQEEEPIEEEASEEEFELPPIEDEEEVQEEEVKESLQLNESNENLDESITDSGFADAVKNNPIAAIKEFVEKKDMDDIYDMCINIEKVSDSDINKLAEGLVSVGDALDSYKWENRTEEEKRKVGNLTEDISAEQKLISLYNSLPECAKTDDEDKAALTEDVASSMPVTILPASQIKDFLKTLPPINAEDKRPPRFFKLGYIKEVINEIASKYRGGRGSAGEPKVRIFKCIEYSSLYTGFPWYNTNATKAADKELGTARHTGEKTGFAHDAAVEFKNKVGVYPDGSEALQAYITDGSKQKVKWFISLDDEDLREVQKADIAPYLTPAQAEKVLNPSTARKPAGFDAQGNAINDKAINRFKLSGIYMIGNLGKPLFESLDEAFDYVSNDEFKAMINNPLYKSLGECKAKTLEDLEEVDDESINAVMSDYLDENYSNVKNFKTTNCELKNNKLVLEGCINFKSGKSKQTAFIFEKVGNTLIGSNEQFGKNSKFEINCKFEDNKAIAESLHYRYAVNKKLVEGTIKRK